MLKKSQSWGLSSGLDQSRPFSRSHQLPAYIPDKVFKPTQTAEASRYDAFAFAARATLADLRPDTEGLTGSRIWLIILISMGEKNRGMYLVSTSDKSLTGRFCYRRQTPRGPFQATSLLLTEKKSKSFSFVYVDTQCRFTEGPKSYSDHGRAEPKLLLAFIVTGRETYQRNPSYAQVPLREEEVKLPESVPRRGFFFTRNGDFFFSFARQLFESQLKIS